MYLLAREKLRQEIRHCRRKGLNLGGRTAVVLKLCRDGGEVESIAARPWTSQVSHIYNAKGRSESIASLAIVRGKGGHDLRQQTLRLPDSIRGRSTWGNRKGGHIREDLEPRR